MFHLLVTFWVSPILPSRAVTPKVHIRYHFLPQNLFAVVIVKLLFLEYDIVTCTYS